MFHVLITLSILTIFVNHNIFCNITSLVYRVGILLRPTGGKFKEVRTHYQHDTDILYELYTWSMTSFHHKVTEVPSPSYYCECQHEKPQIHGVGWRPNREISGHIKGITNWIQWNLKREIVRDNNKNIYL